MSSKKETKVVSVLANFLNPFFLLSSWLCSVKYDSSWRYLVFSCNLANIGSWEIGLEINISSGVHLEYFIYGIIIENFSCWEIFPVTREILIRSFKSCESVVDSFSCTGNWEGIIWR